jgi:hypothetical protein
LVSTSRSHIHRLETQLGELAELIDQLPGVPRDLAKAAHELNRQPNKTGLTHDELRERLDKLKELRVMPEERTDEGQL